MCCCKPFASRLASASRPQCCPQVDKFTLYERRKDFSVQWSRVLLSAGGSKISSETNANKGHPKKTKETKQKKKPHQFPVDMQTVKIFKEIFPKSPFFLRKARTTQEKAKLVKTEQTSENFGQSLSPPANNQRDRLFVCRGFGSAAGEPGSVGHSQWPSQRCLAKKKNQNKSWEAEEPTWRNTPVFRRSARNLFASLEGRKKRPFVKRFIKLSAERLKSP